MILLPNGMAHQRMELNERQIKVLVAIEPLLREMQLHLACPKCLAAGRTQDALVGGQNAPGDAVWTVSCACTDRAYRRGH